MEVRMTGPAEGECEAMTTLNEGPGTHRVCFLWLPAFGMHPAIFKALGWLCDYPLSPLKFCNLFVGNEIPQPT